MTDLMNLQIHLSLAAVVYSCPVYYSKPNDRLECPCHEGGFDVHDGRNLYGPPPRPLDRIEIEERNGEVWAIGRNESGGQNEGGI